MANAAGPVIADDVLAARDVLPAKLAPVTLETDHITLRPFVESDIAPLFSACNGQPFNGHPAYDPADMWRFMPHGPYSPDDLDQFTQDVRTVSAVPHLRAFTVVDKASELPIGFATVLNNVPAHLKAELGYIWYTPAFHRTYANTDSTHLLLRHLFSLGYRRVEWKCDDLNEPSKRAALRLGFRAEGVQQSHFIVKRRNRDTAWFAITSDDWPAVDARLSALRAKYDAVPPTGSDATTAGAGAGVGAGSEADAATDNAATACTAGSDRIVARTVPEPAVGVGDAFPAVTVRDGSTKQVALATLLAGRRVVLFAVPGAFTPGCSRTHLPGYVAQAPTLRALGVQDIICISVNDPFVVAAWGEAHNAGGAVRMLADPSSSLPPLLGMAMSAPVFGTPDRLQRFSMVIDDGVIVALAQEPDGHGLSCSLAEPMIDTVKRLPPFKST